MKKMPWVRFFASDWLGGTRGMSAVETGVYITLIASMYERGEPIPEDHNRLARLCGASNSAFKAVLETLVSEGKIIRSTAGLWNNRVEKERVYLSEKSEVGLRAANARWSRKDNDNNGGSDANAMPTQSEGNANQKPDTRNHISESFSLRSKDGRANEFEKFWEIYPNKVGKAAARVSFGKAVKRTSIETILAGAEKYAAKEDDRAWCNPSTWLNQDRWEDNPAVVQPRAKPESEHARYQREMQEALERAVRGERAHPGPTIDLDVSSSDHHPVDPEEEQARRIQQYIDHNNSWG